MKIWLISSWKFIWINHCSPLASLLVMLLFFPQVTFLLHLFSFQLPNLLLFKFFIDSSWIRSIRAWSKGELSDPLSLFAFLFIWDFFFFNLLQDVDADADADADGMSSSLKTPTFLFLDALDPFPWTFFKLSNNICLEIRETFQDWNRLWEIKLVIF